MYAKSLQEITCTVYYDSDAYFLIIYCQEILAHAKLSKLFYMHCFLNLYYRESSQGLRLYQLSMKTAIYRTSSKSH